MGRFIIEGGYKLKGEIQPQGAKNEALQVICATLLTTEPVVIKNVPNILDINNLIGLLHLSIFKETAIAVSYFSIERCLVIDTARQTIHRLILLIFRLIGDTCPWTDIYLIIIAPVIGPQAARKYELAFVLIRYRPRILYKAVKIVDG